MTTHTNTDCRSEHGITVGLIDSLISICRVLKDRNFASEAVNEAIKDLISDEDVDMVFCKAREHLVKQEEGVK